MGTPPESGPRLLEALARRPGGALLLERASSHLEVELVGGAVRDLMLDRAPRELDVVLVGDPSALASELAGALGGEMQVHDRFGTALVRGDGARIDLASRRAESYPAPGALPEVRPGTREEDLARRDFTVNAISLTLTGDGAGRTHAVEHAREDLRQGVLRVLHASSFVDDPTRLFRAARYAARLGFVMHEETAELAGQALAAGALESLSGARAGAELRLALEEEDPLSALAELQRTGVLGALHPRLRVDARLTQKALELAGPQESRVVVLLASLTLALAVRADGAGRAEVAAFLDRLEFQAPDRDRAASAAAGAARLLDALEGARADAEIHDACAWALPEGVALAGALAPEGSQARRAAERWLQAVRHVRLDITGDDLLAAGVGAGPEVGERLRAALRARLEGTIGEGREEELRAALAAPAGERRVEGSR